MKPDVDAYVTLGNTTIEQTGGRSPYRAQRRPSNFVKQALQCAHAKLARRLKRSSEPTRRRWISQTLRAAKAGINR
jgi:hypothetical protein